MSLLKKLLGLGGGDETQRQPSAGPSVPTRDGHIDRSSFFDPHIRQLQETLGQFDTWKQEMTTNHGPDADFTNLYYGRCKDNINLASAMYSRGDDMATVLPIARQPIKDIAHVWREGEDYSQSGEVSWKLVSTSVALGVLSDAEPIYFERLSAKLMRNGFKDTVVDYLLTPTVPTHPVSQQPFVPGYPSIDALGEIIFTEGATETQQLAEGYLQRLFYTKANLETTYDKHKTHGGLYYYGYWAWLLAAILKAKGSDVSGLLASPYFPQDFFTNPTPHANDQTV